MCSLHAYSLTGYFRYLVGLYAGGVLFCFVGENKTLKKVIIQAKILKKRLEYLKIILKKRTKTTKLTLKKRIKTPELILNKWIK